MGRNPDRETVFRFKKFSVSNASSAMKIGTDSVLLGAWADVAGVRNALDAGCGSGVLALMLAQRGVRSVVCVDIDPAATDETRGNILGSPFDLSPQIVTGDYAEVINDPIHESAYDLIISNPPFFNSALRSDDGMRALARHENSLGIDTLMKSATRCLTATGRIAIVFPSDRNDDVEWAAAINGLHLARRCDVATNRRRGVRRTLWEFGKTPCTPTVSELTINGDDGSFTPEYIDLTKEFYLFT